MSFDCILDHATNECKNDKNLGKMTKSLVSGSQGEIGTKTWEKIHSKIEQLPGKKACRNTQRMQIKNKKMQKNVFVFPHPAFRCRVCAHFLDVNFKISGVRRVFFNDPGGPDVVGVERSPEGVFPQFSATQKGGPPALLPHHRAEWFGGGGPTPPSPFFPRHQPSKKQISGHLLVQT